MQEEEILETTLRKIMVLTEYLHKQQNNKPSKKVKPVTNVSNFASMFGGSK